MSENRIRKKVMYKDGSEVRVLSKINQPEGEATIREITENWKILIQFDDRMVVPNWRELNPSDIGAYVQEIAPPLGLRPRYIWVSHRMEEIREAIARYEAADMEVPRAWRAELDALSGSVFTELGRSKPLTGFAEDVAYHPAYSVQDLERMEKDIKPYLVAINESDFQIQNGRLIVQKPSGEHEAIVEQFVGNKNYPYLIAFLLNNALNFLRRK